MSPCYFCQAPITEGEEIEYHHPIYKSRGGEETRPAHKACHRSHHSQSGDFAEWGRLSSLTRRWAFNLKNVKDNPAFDFDRAFYLAHYAH
jgi:hypothetical protein